MTDRHLDFADKKVDHRDQSKWSNLSVEGEHVGRLHPYRGHTPTWYMIPFSYSVNVQLLGALSVKNTNHILAAKAGKGRFQKKKVNGIFH